MQNKMMGHEFLAKLGKKRLRPGGVKATNYLINYIKKNYSNVSQLKILEVSCNRGFSLMFLWKHLKCKLYGIDINSEVIEIAKKNIKDKKLENYIKVFNMNALDMNFNNEKFDIIINEALLTMCKDKNLFLNEYKKHLKKGGIILTHDICILNDETEKYSNDMKQVINLKPFPLSESLWIETFKKSDLEILDYKMFDFSLVTIKGLIKDEGLFNMLKIIKNANKKENKQDFVNMRNYFLKNKNNMKAICFILKLK